MPNSTLLADVNALSPIDMINIEPELIDTVHTA